MKLGMHVYYIIISMRITCFHAHCLKSLRQFSLKLLLCIPSLSCLPFFLYHPYIYASLIRRIFNLLVTLIKLCVSQHVQGACARHVMYIGEATLSEPPLDSYVGAILFLCMWYSIGVCTWILPFNPLGSIVAFRFAMLIISIIKAPTTAHKMILVTITYNSIIYIIMTHSSTLFQAFTPLTMSILNGEILTTKHFSLSPIMEAISTHSPSTSWWMELVGELAFLPPTRRSCPPRVPAVEWVTGRGGRGVQDMSCGGIGWSLGGRARREHE